jgi:GGDEF domain-containing protein
MDGLKSIVVICRDAALNEVIRRVLEDRYRIVVFSSMPSALDCIYDSTPELIVMSIGDDDRAGIRVLNDLKSDPMFHPLPVLAILPEAFTISDWHDLLVEDYIRRQEMETDFAARVKLSILRSKRTMEINPLTRLPGNISINREIQERLDHSKEFAFGYADLDFFKPFNDRYGFSRGDEVIKMTARIILGVIKCRQPQGSFVGHIGGDDFVFIIDAPLAEEAAGEIIKAFDSLIPGMYDPADLSQGFIKSFDRRGKAAQFPVMCISIGVAETRHRTFDHYGEITEIAVEMKKLAKQFKGSCFKTDRRQDKTAGTAEPGHPSQAACPECP